MITGRRTILGCDVMAETHQKSNEICGNFPAPSLRSLRLGGKFFTWGDSTKKAEYAEEAQRISKNWNARTEKASRPRFFPRRFGARGNKRCSFRRLFLKHKKGATFLCACRLTVPFRCFAEVD